MSEEGRTAFTLQEKKRRPNIWEKTLKWYTRYAATNQGLGSAPEADSWPSSRAVSSRLQFFPSSPVCRLGPLDTLPYILATSHKWPALLWPQSIPLLQSLPEAAPTSSEERQDTDSHLTSKTAIGNSVSEPTCTSLHPLRSVPSAHSPARSIVLVSETV